jgi:putative transposase
MAATSASSLFEGGRNGIPLLYQDLANWPTYDPAVLTGNCLIEYQRREKAMRQYLAWRPLKDVLATAGVSAQRWRELVKRCGRPLPDGSIVGLQGLAPGQYQAPRQRRAEIVPSRDPRAGYSGAFQMFMAANPQIERLLVAYLIALGPKAFRPNRVAFRGIHRAFLRICREQGIREDQYPFNTEERCRRALRLWIDRVYLPKHSMRAIQLENGPDAAVQAGFGQGSGTAEGYSEPYSDWVLDEVTVDVNARYELPSPGGDWDELDLARFAQLRMRVRNGGATLSLRHVFAKQANADDVALLFWDAINGPPPVPEAVPGLKPTDGAGYPSVVIPELRFAIPRRVYLDNALSHLSAHVQYICAKLLGAEMILGAPGTPRDRADIESENGVQARNLLHQLPATSGTGPKDPVRKRAAMPLEGRLRAVEVEHALDVHARNRNALPTAGAFHISALERLRRQIGSGVLKPVHLAPEKRHAFFFSAPRRVQVKEDRERGARPFINFLYVRYGGAVLVNAFDLVDTYLLLRADLRNLRTVMLFRLDGTLLGPVQALGKWGTFPHDARMRRLFGVLKRRGELGERADDEPLEALFAHLRNKAPRDRNAALQLAYLVEYLTRSQVSLTSTLAQGVNEWEQLQHAASNVRVLPIKPRSAPPASQVKRPDIASPVVLTRSVQSGARPLKPRPNIDL